MTSTAQPGTAQFHYQTRGKWLQIRSTRGFEWLNVELPIPNLPADLAGFRILHLSDLHALRRWDPAYDNILSRVAANPPDLILFTGDFVDFRYDYRVALSTVQKFLINLKSRLGIVGILGNHDGDLIAPSVLALNIPLVDQKCLTLRNGQTTIEILGLAGVDRDDVDDDWLMNLPPKSPNTLRIALSHFPSTIRGREYLSPDLYFSGHTHGGQICLPGGWPIFRHDKFPRRLCSGIHRAFGTWLIISRGVGFSSLIPARAFCSTQVIEVTLVGS